MALFICAKCGCVDNTATSSYWSLISFDNVEKIIWDESLKEYKGKALCSECACMTCSKDNVFRVIPGKWHDKFPKEKATEDQKRRAGRNGIIL